MRTILRNFFNVLKRFKIATILNVLGLTVAFAAFILIMMQVSYDHNYNKQIKNADSIFRLEVIFGEDGSQAVISRPVAEAFFDSSPHIQAGAVLNMFWGSTVLEVGKEEGKQIFEEQVMPVTDGITDVFEFDILEGIAESVHEPDKILLPESVAKKIFPVGNAINQRINFADRNFTVGGVYKDFPVNSSVRNAIYFSMRDENKNNTGNYNYIIMVRLTSPDVADEVMANYMEYTHQETFKTAFGWDASHVKLKLTPFKELHYVKHVDYDPEEKASRQTLAVMIAIAFILLIIAAINFTNFSMALTPMRVKSINTQKVMGAGQAALRRALLFEAICICVFSFLFSLLVVFIFTNTELRNLVSGNTSLLYHMPIILTAGGMALLLSLFAGLYPAYYMTSFPPALVLKGSFGLSPKGRLLRNMLLGFQFIASFALIIGAAFMFLQNHFMQNSNLGYDKDQLIITHLNSELSKNKNKVLDQLMQFPGIDNITSSQFILSSGDRYMGWGRKYRDKEISFQCLPVDPSFLKVMGIDVLEGRDFRQDDERTKGGTYIFNQKARYDLELELNEKIDEGEIVGFIDDIKFASFRTEVIPMAFHIWGTEEWGNAESNNSLYIRVKGGTNMREAYQYVENTLKSFDAAYPFKVRFFDSVFERTYEKERNMTILITLFSLVAIFISIVGVFGLVIFESQYRIKEIGIRKVLGSSTGEIIVMFNKVYLRILVICFALAAPIGYIVVTNWLENFAYRTPLHWWVFLAAFVIITIITVITVTFQNWRAANANPVESVKNE